MLSLKGAMIVQKIYSFCIYALSPLESRQGREIPRSLPRKFGRGGHRGRWNEGGGGWGEGGGEEWGWWWSRGREGGEEVPGTLRLSPTPPPPSPLPLREE